MADRRSAEKMTIGKVYRLRGGLILRYQGPWGGKGPCLAFRPVRDGVTEPPAGYSTGPEQITGEVTSADLGWVRERREQAAARNLLEEVADMDHLIKELESTLTSHLTRKEF